MASEGSAGVVPVNADLTGEFDFTSTATSAAQGGNIKTGTIFNFSGSNFGLVKMLTLAGIALIAYRIYRSK